jgi:hypothetical protein
MNSLSEIPLWVWPLAAVTIGLWIWSIVWAYGDARRRGKPAILVALLVALVSWPLGLLIWVIFRPER